MMKYLVVCIALFYGGELFSQNLTVEEDKLDFGEVLRDARDIEHTFTIRNDGDEDLVIEKVRTSCGCAGGRVGKARLKPGESTTVNVTFKPATEYGKKVYSVFLVTNDKNGKVKRLELKANVIAVLGIEPQEVIFDVSDKFDIAALSNALKVENMGTNMIDNLRVRSISPYFAVSGDLSVKQLLGEAKINYKVELNSGLMPESNHSGFLRFDGQVGKEKIFKLVRVLVKRDKDAAFDRNEIRPSVAKGWEYAPAVVELSIDKSSQLFRVISMSEDKFYKLDVTSVSPNITVEPIVIDSNVKDYRCDYMIKLKPGYKPTKTEYSILQIRGILGGESIKKVVSLQIKP